MSRVVKVPPDVRADAAMWLARLRADDKSVADEQAFHAWLAQDRSHVVAFEAMTELWEAAGRAQSRAPSRSLPAFASRRQLILGGVGAFSVAASILLLKQRAYAGTYKTAVGEQRHIVLSDGTQAFLDTDTSIRADFGGETRSIELEHGRCNFHVMENDSRPFVVNADVHRIVAGQTTLSVERDGAAISVVVQHGSAAVSGGRLAPEKPCVLKAGDRLMVSRTQSRVDHPNLAQALAWQTGQAVFENDTLATVIQEMNRYSEVKLTASDAATAQMRISGVYRVGDNVAFARSVIALLPVTARVEPNRILFEKNITRTKGV